MAQKKNEFTPPGEEFTAPGEEFTRPGEEFRPPEREMAPCCSQYAVPPAEFAPVPGLGLWGGDGKKRHKWRFLLYVAAMALFLFIVFILPKLSGETPLPTGGPVLSGEPTPGGADASPAPGSEPTPTPTPTASPEPTPEPEPEPECKTVFVAFSSALKARLAFTKPENFKKVYAELFDNFSETVLDSWEIDLNALNEDDEYDLPIPDIYEYWSSHPELYEDDWEKFPEPVLRTTCVYTNNDGKEVEVEDASKPLHMLGFGGRYVEEEGDFWGKGDADSFVIATWEDLDPISVIINGDPETEEATLFITVEVNGRRIDEKDFHVEYTEESYEDETGEETVYYYATISAHRPADAPEPGKGSKAVVTVVQPVKGADYNWKDEFELKY